MKVRNGFVSNSSSSSFCIYGASVDEEDLRKIADYFGAEYEEDEDGDITDDLNEVVEEVLNEKGINITIHYGPDSEVFLGRDWTGIGDDETGGMFKDSVDSFFAKYLPGTEADTHEDGWFDG